MSAKSRSLPAKDLPDKDRQADWQAGACGGNAAPYRSKTILLIKDTRTLDQ
jgi:hypothetical protein